VLRNRNSTQEKASDVLIGDHRHLITPQQLDADPKTGLAIYWPVPTLHNREVAAT
jgi:hypothetical protein